LLESGYNLATSLASARWQFFRLSPTPIGPGAHKGCDLCRVLCARHGGSAEEGLGHRDGAERRPRSKGMGVERGQRQYKGWGPTPRAQRRGLFLRESCYNVVTRAPTVGRPDHCVGAVPVGPPLALAASRGPGLAHSRLPRPANGERGAG
jgi:hypothetical protein